MTLHALNKKKIIAALLELRKNYDGSDTKFAEMFDLNPSVFSQIKAGKVDNIVSDENLVAIGMRLGINMTDAVEWNIAKTVAFGEYVSLMDSCQKNGISRMICDKSDRGKTAAAKWFMLNRRNVFYVDCSQNRSYKLFIKAMAKSMGLNSSQPLDTIIQNIKRFLIATPHPMVIMDEFGDLKYDPFLEMKGFWNATEGACAWIAIGAQGLKKKIERLMELDKIGFEEFRRRWGSDYYSVKPFNLSDAEERMFWMAEAEMVVAANMPKMKVKELMSKSLGGDTIYSLTRIKERIINLKRNAA